MRRHKETEQILESKEKAMSKIASVTVHLKLVMDLGESVAKVKSLDFFSVPLIKILCSSIISRNSASASR